MATLLTCVECSRHFRITEARCPFCEAPAASGEGRRVTVERLGRVAMLLFSATSATACGGTASPPAAPEATPAAKRSPP